MMPTSHPVPGLQADTHVFSGVKTSELHEKSLKNILFSISNKIQL